MEHWVGISVKTSGSAPWMWTCLPLICRLSIGAISVLQSMKYRFCQYYLWAIPSHLTGEEQKKAAINAQHTNNTYRRPRALLLCCVCACVRVRAFGIQNFAVARLSAKNKALTTVLLNTEKSKHMLMLIGSYWALLERALIFCAFRPGPVREVGTSQSSLTHFFNRLNEQLIKLVAMILKNWSMVNASSFICKKSTILLSVLWVWLGLGSIDTL